MEFGFIKNKALRNRIEESVEYVLILVEEAREVKNKKHQTEKYRTVVLYSTSVIEALLFDIYHRIGEKIKKVVYKDPSELNTNYKHETQGGRVVVAVRTTLDKAEIEIGFVELLSFLKIKKILKAETVERIRVLNSMRNTIHLRKKGDAQCSITDVEEALSLLELTIKNTPRFIK